MTHLCANSFKDSFHNYVKGSKKISIYCNSVNAKWVRSVDIRTAVDVF